MKKSDIEALRSVIQEIVAQTVSQAAPRARGGAKESMVTLTARVPKGTTQALDRLANSQGLTRSEALRTILDEALSTAKKGQ